jgi:glycosyltransferase involved in cell wall biosynthesis
MIKLPLITIVIVSYNHSNYLIECLNSIQSQTYSNIDLIVADDASTDNSVQVIENWLLKNNIKAKKNFHKKNTGVAQILNECIELAEGKYIKLIAADDFLEHTCIEKSVAFFEQEDPHYGMLFTDVYTINNDSAIIPDIANYNELANCSPEKFNKELLKGNRIAALSVCMKLDVLKQTGAYDTEFIAEDYYRWLKISEKYWIGYIPEKLAYYRLHDSNISKNKKNLVEEDFYILSMRFDKTGYNKTNINAYLIQRFLDNNLNERITREFKQYPHQKLWISLALKNRWAGNIIKHIIKLKS